MSRNEVAVGTDNESVMFWTRRAAGPTIGVSPGCGMRDAGGVGVVAGTLPASRISLPESASSRLVGITGSSASLPLSNRFRHSSPTEAGSRRYCSYITCTNAALWVPKTNSLTSSNLIRCQPSAISDRQIMRVMSRCAFLLLGLLPCGAGAAQRLPSVRERLAARVAQAPATGVGLYYRSLTHPDSLLLDANVRFHAASTMKLPVLIQVFRDADAGLLRILEAQEFNEGIPVGLPPGTRVAHKTGWIGEVVYHDAAVVYRSSGGSYVLVVLTGGIKQDSVAHNLVADLSRLVYGARSEEHTSELQSPDHLVCRLLLEKKKI